MTDPSPLLSVCVITYNHASYIKRTLESILKQRLDVPWEVVVADDCSNDGTMEVIRSIAVRNPHRIRTIFQPSNVGPSANFAQLIEAARGDFIAYCEGDDYWTDSQKLKKQLDFLLTNEDFSTCFHNAIVEYDYPGKDAHLLVHSNRDVFGFKDVVEKNFSVPTCSLVFKNIFKGATPSGLILLDWVVLMLLAQEGSIKFINETMAVKTQHVGGWTSRKWSDKAKHLIEVTKLCRDYFGERFRDDFDRVLAKDYADVCFGYFQENKISEFLLMLDEAKRYRIFLPSRTKRALRAREIACRVPAVYRLFAKVSKIYRDFATRRSDEIYFRQF